MRTKEVNSWLKSRHAQHSKEVYLLSLAELSRLEEIKQIFTEFDVDKSGTLDLVELLVMFKSYGLTINKTQLKDLFSVVRPRNRNFLTFDEFKRFVMGAEGQESEGHLEFRQLVTALKSQHPDKAVFIPNDISAMIKHLLLLSKSHQIASRIGSVRLTQSSLQNDLELFQKIFALRPSMLEQSASNLSQYFNEKLPTTKPKEVDYTRSIAHKIDLARKSNSYAGGLDSAKKCISTRTHSLPSLSSYHSGKASRSPEKQVKMPSSKAFMFGSLLPRSRRVFMSSMSLSSKLDTKLRSFKA
jgi:hypothetical protein